MVKNKMVNEVSSALLRCELFVKLTEKEIQPISSLCQIETYKPGEQIFNQGDQGSKIYIIKDGQVTLERVVDLGERKATVSIAILGRGRAFGCWSVLWEEAHNLMSSAVCNKKTQVISVEGLKLKDTLKNNPQVGYKVMERLAYLLGDRLRGAYGAMEKL